MIFSQAFFFQYVVIKLFMDYGACLGPGEPLSELFEEVYESDRGVMWCDGGGLRTLNRGEVGRMQMSSRFKCGCFFIHGGLIESYCGRDEWNMHGAAALYPPAGPMINFCSLVCVYICVCGLVAEMDVTLCDRTVSIHKLTVTDSAQTAEHDRNRKLLTSSALISPFKGPAHHFSSDHLQQSVDDATLFPDLRLHFGHSSLSLCSGVYVAAL